MAATQKKNLASFRRKARRNGWRVQVSSHGAGRYSVQAFDATGLVADVNL